ncbi:glycoside hydrolase family 92 protein [Dokdonia sinensis]|uniref:Glycoside hydrolase family 92 protein n=1 Tax=Dokdonia sinensis TaxID=2479847 RepID=A0A3M0GMW4_9FLAO|nr:GH92 family glycosyl hydrolase [Dokdonia sinensis]RMB62973.1 glycoside hydrolase family 92 protein [Dokdonia sinensis]
MRSYLLLLISTTLFLSCDRIIEVTPAQKDRPLINYVNPFIGTGGHGHTYPGATMPFGMMQLSPDTRLDGWDGCSGYHYDDEYIYGFSHTHLSGTGVSDYGDILLMPSTTINFNNGADGNAGYRDHFSHDNEIAQPGYYKVHLDSTNIDVELTVAERSGVHKYAFAKADSLRNYLILDLDHRDEVLDAKVDTLSTTELSGYRHSKAWANKQMLFYYIKTSHPFKFMKQSSSLLISKKGEKANKAALKFDNPKNEPIIIKIGISAVDESGAKNNLETEIGDKSFEEVKQEAQAKWEKQLEKIIVESSNTEYKTNFYTSLYHTMLAPNLYQDVDGRYRGMDLEVHQTTDFKYYTVFSLWDTYRAAHPLYTIIEEKRTNDFINTMLAKYDEGGIIPIWDLSGNYTGCMIGYHGIPVIADAYIKGIRGYDTEKAFEAMIHSATRDKLGLKVYKEFGFIPVEEESESVSKTLEYAYDDWTIAQVAKEMGDGEMYETFIKRAQSYKNVFDPETGFMRGRMRNKWFAPFDPFEVNFNYTEANAWQYSFYVPQDITGFTKLLGGKKMLEKKLDELFTAESQTSGRDQADITGLIGQYAHGNEPSHHMAYLYNFINKPWKTQERVHEIMTTMYHDAPDGISGNEDCGQMSAWYVFSSLGFYPVTPGTSEYVIGKPLFDKATINLENGNQFTITAENLNEENRYIASAKMNGSAHPYSYLKHSDILDGGALTFEMSTSPSRWGKHPAHSPKTEIKDHLFTPAPFIEQGDIAFKGETTIVLGSVEKDAEIYFALSKKEPFKRYRKPITISQPTTLRTYTDTRHGQSTVIETQFFQINENLSIQLDAEYANAYNAGGNDALIDGIRGTVDFRTGTWQGYSDQDVIATLDLSKNQTINSIEVGFLQDQRSWIFYPTEVSYLISQDGKTYTEVFKENYESSKKDDAIAIRNITATPNTNARYIKVVAKTVGPVPEWHLGYDYDGKAWLFLDEIVIR